jgi:hypothetical protein
MAEAEARQGWAGRGGGSAQAARWGDLRELGCGLRGSERGARGVHGVDECEPGEPCRALAAF